MYSAPTPALSPDSTEQRRRDHLVDDLNFGNCRDGRRVVVDQSELAEDRELQVAEANPDST